MNEIIEEWRPICGYEGLYQVSNYGRIKSLKFGKEKILKQIKNNNGYLKVTLCKEGKIKNCNVHRLVATAFIDNPNSLPCVNHKDENSLNNQVDNLEWCTHQYNSNYGTCIQRRVSNTDYKARTANTDYKARTAKIDYKARTAKIDYKAIGRKNAEKQSKKVFQYDKQGNLIKIWQSVNECGRNGFQQGAVSQCCRSELKHYKNYIWSYYPL